MIFELNYDNQAKEILEGQRRYREQMNSQYTAGYTDAEEKYEPELAKNKAEISELRDENTELNAEKAAFMQLINQLDEPDADKEAILSKLRELKK
ncbi:hypothetical protein D6853_08360 [Butyrivibrio sp. X503]|uniref:hypothetical protein n=1 Tax=Butyrivibrio sp. X503 TaxID=2364878 RepID=UPI000EAAB27C|nr:hypothetical protein [Butyrivibrio sp. X503]RKM55560.1 hypothetical protein D6853_08360 [Butyrivibrio sp. X503]